MTSDNKLTYIIDSHKRLQSCSIKIPPEIASAISLLEQLTKVFYESNIKKMEECERIKKIEHEELERIKKTEQEQKEILEACRGLIQDMWMIFWFEQLKKIEEYHCSIKSGWDESNYDRQQDVKTKFLQIHQVLLDNWLHPFPPFGQLLLSESKLVGRMIYSQKYIHKCHIDDAISKTEYGYVSPPQLKDTNLSYTINSYIDYRMSHHSEHDIGWYGNTLLENLLSNNYDEKDICNLALNKYRSKTYRELYETSALKNYINFEPDSPNLEYQESYKLRDLFSYEWNGSDSEENSDSKENSDSEEN
jgi:hypothetical protein